MVLSWLSFGALLIVFRCSLGSFLLVFLLCLMLVLCVLWPPWSFFIVLGCQSALFDGIGAYLGNFWRRLASLAGILIVSMRPGIAIDPDRGSARGFEAATASWKHCNSYWRGALGAFLRSSRGMPLM